MQDEDVQVPVPELLSALLEKEGSDLHLTAGVQPVVRVHGDLERLMDFPILTPRALQGMIILAAVALDAVGRRGSDPGLTPVRPPPDHHLTPV